MRKAGLSTLSNLRWNKVGSDPLPEPAVLSKRSSAADPVRKSSSQDQRAGRRGDEVLAGRGKCQQTLGLSHRSPENMATGRNHC